jgi:hypothetical protein
MSRAFASLDRNEQEKLRSELVRLWSAHNYSDGDTTKVYAEYLEVITTRGGTIPSVPQKTATHNIGDLHRPSSCRGEALADRIEEGAAGLAAFAEALSEAEWRTPVSESDGRSVGVIVHPVASVYPAEIDCARTIAGGKAVTDVT